MDRPVMHPELFPLESPKKPRRQGGRIIAKFFGFIAGILLYDLFGSPRKRPQSISTRLLRMFIRGVAAVPIAIFSLTAAVVYIATHPPVLANEMDPSGLAQYYEPINLVSSDGVRNEAWLIPALDARQIIDLGDKALSMRRPAVVLVHDFGSSRQQMLPFVRPLHDAGMVVMIVGLRGESTSLLRGQTFGAAESLDVLAAVDVLKRQRYVDPAHIAVFGIGTGATAARIAARHDSQIAALVLQNACATDNIVATRLSPVQPWLSNLQPLCKWMFESAYSVSANELNYDPILDAPREQRPVLVVGSKSECTQLQRITIAEMTSFFHHNMFPQLADVHE